MAIPDQVTAGQQVQLDTTFYDNDNQPFVSTTPATYIIRDFNKNLIMQGTFAQDPVNPARWFTNLTLPSNTPVGNVASQRYSFQCSITDGSQSLTQQYFFTVQAPFDFDFVELDRLALEQAPLIDSLAAEIGETISDVSITIFNSQGRDIFDSPVNMNPGDGNLSVGYAVNNKMVFTYIGTAPIPTMTASNNLNFDPYIIQWVYTSSRNGLTDTEYHFLHVVNPRVLIKTHQLRKFLDRAMAINPNPALNWNDVDLVGYLAQGVQIINMSKPILTSWNVVNMPSSLDFGLNQAAAYVALSAQYLAEGQAAFSFSGSSVNLEIDRTPYLDASITRTMEFVENQIPAAKRMWIRATGGSGQGAGILGVNVGPSLGWSTIGFRFDTYRLMLLGIGG